MKFELSNTQRQYLGLKPVENHWEKVQLNPQIWLYFEADTIKKEISVSENFYAEKEMDEATENRTVLLPKSKRGKPKKLNFTAISKRNGIGTYFRYTKKQGVTIGNYNTQKTYYSSYFLNEEIPNFTALNNWITSFIAESNAKDLADIKAFGTEKRKRIKIKEGDFFCYKKGRKNYGFGRILLDVRKLRKDTSFDTQKNRGLASLMAQPLAIKVYHALSDSKDIDIDNLKKTLAFPSQYIMDNRFFYGDYEIIGHAPLEDHELDFPIHFSPIFESGMPTGKSHLQWGLINKEAAPLGTLNTSLSSNGLGLDLKLNKMVLETCIAEKSNAAYWALNGNDVRNPAYKTDKKLIFEHFGLSTDKGYAAQLQNTSTT